MNFCINQVIMWFGTEDPKLPPILERILWIDSSASQIVTIEITEQRVMPRLQQCDQIILAVENGEAQITTLEPMAVLLRLDDDIPEAHRCRRDEVWALIKPLVEKNDPEIMLSPKRRGKLISEIVKRSGWDKSYIYKLLQQYWKSGGYKNALLPKYNCCGGRGNSRIANSPSSGPKRGRPRQYSSTRNGNEGINITTEIEKYFEKGIKRFYEKSTEGSLSRAFQLILNNFFNCGFELKSGEPSPILVPVEERPTERQFRYWYKKKYRNVRREMITRYGDRDFNLLHRELLGDSTQMAIGPGSLCQIDATIADVYLVSSLDRDCIIGRPVIYACIDVFSRMIIGLSVSLEGPSWVGAMLALDNVVSDKVAFCAEYGITIQEENWPCHYLPDEILADRGEFEGHQPNHLAHVLKIKISNTPPYRADWKGIVERHFRIANERVIHFTPGAVRRARIRGDKDYRLKAILTLNDFRKLIIQHALDYNQNYYLTSYPKNEMQISDSVERFPLELWNWGIRNQAGHLRAESRDYVRLHLLPRKKATVTPKGIHLERGLYYTCDLAQREDWFVRARADGAWKVDVSYDPRAIDTIYLHLEGRDRPMEPCILTEKSRTFRGLDWYEVVDYDYREKEAAADAKGRIQQTQADLHAQQEKIIKDAIEETEAARKLSGYKSKNERTRNIRENRKEEREREQAEQGWRLTAPDENENTELLSEGTEDDYVPSASQVEALRKSREKKWSQENNNKDE